MIRAVRGAGWRARAPCPALAQFCGCHRRDVQAPQYAETPRPSRPSPAPTLAAQLETGSRRDAPLRVLEVMGPLPVHASVDSPKPRRQAAASVQGNAAPRAGGRLSAAAGCGEHSSVIADSHDQRSRRDYRNRGQAITRPHRVVRVLAVGSDRAALDPHDRFWAIAAARSTGLPAVWTPVVRRHEVGNHDRSAALRLPRRGALRYVRRFRSAACGSRPCARRPGKRFGADRPLLLSQAKWCCRSRGSCSDRCTRRLGLPPPAGQARASRLRRDAVAGVPEQSSHAPPRPLPLLGRRA
jgi:hypothetical protein